MLKQGENRVGKTLLALREAKGIAQEELCRGLCSKTALSRYESGDRVPDRLLLNAFLQRMGKAADKMTTVIHIGEYEYLLWKKKALQAVERDDMEALQQLLEKSEAKDISCNENLQSQFYDWMQAIIEERKEGNIESGIRFLCQAIALTMPDVLITGDISYRISVEEIQLIVELARLLVRAGQKQEAERRLEQVIAYSEQYYDDYEAKVKILPKAVKALSPLLIEEQKYMECMLLCERTIQLLCWQGILYDLADLMEYYLQCSKFGFRTEQAVRYEKQLEALKQVYAEYGADMDRPEHTMRFYWNQEIYLVDEVIRQCRIEKGISQEELSEGICTPETLSRIESGRRAPNARNFYALMEKLETEQDYFRPGLDTSDFLLLEKQKEMERAVSLRNWEEAERLLNELKQELDENNLRNHEILTAVENCILFNTRRLSADQFISACEEMLGCEEKWWTTEQIRLKFLSGKEMKLLNYIALVYDSQGKKEEAIYIWENILQKLYESKVTLTDRYRVSMTAIGNLSSAYGEVGRLNDCLKMCKEGIELCLDSGRGVRLATFLVNMAEAMGVNEEKKKACRCYVRQAYYISDLFSVKASNKYVERFYKKNYEENIIWY